MVAVVDHSGTFIENEQRILQLAALNDILKPSHEMVKRGGVSGILPYEIQWMGDLRFRIVCLVGDEVMNSTFFHKVVLVNKELCPFELKRLNPFVTPPDVLETSIVPVAPKSVGSSQHEIMRHTTRVFMCAYMIHYATSFIRDLRGTSNVFQTFWARHQRTGRGNVIPLETRDAYQRGMMEVVNRMVEIVEDKPGPYVEYRSSYHRRRWQKPVLLARHAALLIGEFYEDTEEEDRGFKGVYDWRKYIPYHQTERSEGVYLLVDNKEHARWLMAAATHPEVERSVPKQSPSLGVSMERWMPDLFEAYPWRVAKSLCG